jgi:hypothetical protein
MSLKVQIVATSLLDSPWAVISEPDGEVESWLVNVDRKPNIKILD